MDAILEILCDLGVSSVAEMNVNENHTITVVGFEDLTIEKIGDGRLSVGHFYTHRGDLISDPEVVFVVHESEWRPVRYTQHPLVHEHDESGLDLSNFLSMWDKNLRRQGFVDTAGRRKSDV